jgi:RHS repeat-associated protein
MITRRDFGKLGIGVAAVAARISPFLLISNADAQGELPRGEGGDIRRVGARSNGAYWGHGSERIDLLSGNLSYSVPLLHAHSRLLSAAVVLSYNSQIWKMGVASPHSYGNDSGTGYGWRVQIGVMVPERSGKSTIGYTYIDGTGAEYRLSQNGSTWLSLDGHYATWDPTQGILWFANGSSMTFGSIAGSLEADAGTLYPTLIQDTNGNQILVSYLAGLGQTGINSSGRIAQIQDARTGYAGGGQFSYLFMYSTDRLPRLLSILNAVSSAESYSFSYTPSLIASPFEQGTSGSELVSLLSTVTNTTGLSHAFQYNGFGELTQAKEPHEGILGWNYRTFRFQDGRGIREVSSRSLVDPHSPSNTHTHSFDRDPSDGGGAVHSSVILSGPTGTAQRQWTFSSASGAPDLGHVLAVQELSGTKVARLSSTQWSKTDSGIPYVSNHVETLDPDTTDAYSVTHQYVRDSYGNLTTDRLFENGVSDTPARVTSYTYLTDQAYLDRHMLNRKLASTVQANGETVEAFSVKYDTTPITDRPGLTQHASALFNAGSTLRGNATESYTGGVYNRVQYDITGMPVHLQDSTQGELSLVPAAGSNNALIGMSIPNGNDKLATQVLYQGSKPTAITGANGNTTTHSYDAAGRTTATKESSGRVVSYGYGNGPTTVTHSINGGWEKTTRGGFHQVIKTETGNATGIQATVLHVYGPSANAPDGKLSKVSLPHAVGSKPQWVNRVYDDLGRTISADTPSTGTPMTISYHGNTVKTTDPMGNWKKIVYNASHQIAKVVMPDPNGGPDQQTLYSYNALGNLTSVIMPRAGATQSRSFAYDSGGRIVKSQEPESGLKTSTYNPDGTLATLTDAKGQKHVYTRDLYKRITSIVRSDAQGVPQPNDSYTYFYDTNPFDTGFSQNAQGRLAAVQWGTASTLPGQVTEMYSYNVAGEIVAKRLNINRGGKTAALDLSLSYDQQGRLSSTTYPAGGPALSYTYDSMGRLNGVISPSDSIVKDVAYNAIGQLTSMSLYAAGEDQYLVQGYQYNTRNRLTRLIAAPADPAAAKDRLPSVDLEYTYGPDGQLVTEMNHIVNRSSSYGYDNHGRLLTAGSSDSAWGQGYGYDGFSNLVTQPVTKGQAFSPQEQADPATNWLFGDLDSYDANGNTTYIPGLRLTYDTDNRLVKAEGVGGTEQYRYDHKNLRVWKQNADGTETFHFYDETEELATYALATDSLGNLSFRLQKSNIYFGESLVQSGGQVTVVDQLGATRAWSTHQGYGSADYMPFGQKVAGSGGGLSSFGGYERDATGLDYAQQRYYSSTLGRFITPDPYAGSAHAGDPDSWNRYAFVNNDPMNEVDPHGLNDNTVQDAVLLAKIAAAVLAQEARAARRLLPTCKSLHGTAMALGMTLWIGAIPGGEGYAAAAGGAAGMAEGMVYFGACR